MKPIFLTKEKTTTGGRHRRTATAKVLVSSNAVHITTRIAVYAIARIVTVYTDATKRRREAVFVDLCTVVPQFLS